MTIEEKVASLYSSGADVRHFANLAHNIPGIVFIILAIFILVSGLGYKQKGLSLFYSGFLFIFTVIFLLYFFLSKGIENIITLTQIVLYFPEISIHLVQAAAAIFGSLVEFLYFKGAIKNKLAVLGFPAMLVVIGYTNILHPHGPIHTESDMFFHSLLGAVMTLSGTFLIINRLMKGLYSRTFLILGVITMLIFGYMFVIYREIPNAYEYAFPVKNTSVSNNFVDVGSSGIVYIYSDRVTPQNIKIKSGGKLVFIQVDSSWHDLESGPHPAHTEYPPLNIGFLKMGESRTVDFPNPGEHGFHDHIHENNPKFQGNILVY